MLWKQNGMNLLLKIELGLINKDGPIEICETKMKRGAKEFDTSD